MIPYFCAASAIICTNAWKMQRRNVETGVDSQVRALRDAVRRGVRPVGALRGPGVDALACIGQVHRERVIDRALLDVRERDDTGSMWKAARRRAPTRGGARPCGGVVVPRVLRDVLIAPPHAACQPSDRSRISKNSHSLSVDGCQTVISASASLPGCAPGGMGTAANAACSAARHEAGGIVELHEHIRLIRADYVDLGVRRDPRTNSQSLLARHLGVESAHHRRRTRIKRCVFRERCVPHARRRKERWRRLRDRGGGGHGRYRRG